MQALICNVDDAMLGTLTHAMESRGYQVRAARTAAEAFDALTQEPLRLVIADYNMPGLNALDFCRAIRDQERSDEVYVVMLMAADDVGRRTEALHAGADDIIANPVNAAELLACLNTAERVLSLETRDTTLFAMAKLAESRDPETGAHLERVQHFSRLLAQQLSTTEKYRGTIDGEFIRLIYKTSSLHDIGKAAIPDAVLVKPGPLTPPERKVMEGHVQKGVETLDAAMKQFPNVRFLRMARDIAATHHEKYDGTGYPKGLKAEAIPLSGRIVALADVYDALTSRRVHKDAMSHHDARAILLRQSGKHFDPSIVDAFLKIEDQFIAVRDRLGDEPTVGPRAGSVTELIADAPSAPAPMPGTLPPVLVVEDDQIVRDNLVKLLTQAGYAVLTANDGEQALRILVDRKTQLVISDWIMPGMNGLELCRQARSLLADRHVHFIMLTIQTERARLVEAYDAGVDDFIVKPFDATELLVRLRVGCRAVQTQETLRRENDGSQKKNAQLAVLNSKLEKLAITDDLTGLFNRRHAMVRLDEQWALSSRYGNPLAVATFDIDHFKRVNDTFGHDAGDQVLKEVGRLLRQASRTTDVICRIGGEEFLVIFPLQSDSDAVVYAERCRALMASMPLKINGIEIPVTCSAGIANRTPAMFCPADLLKASDAALYQAKRTGRNRVLTWQQELAKSA
jgi:putative two-component system response regulator